MTYKINGVELTLQPTSGRWLPKSPVGITGDGHPIYPAVREYELRWGLASPSEVDQVRDYFSLSVLTGTLVVDLPQLSAATYTFTSYSGCTAYEPEQNVYYTEYVTDIVMMIGNIRA